MISIIRSIRRDIRAARERDPAASSDLEILLAYPGFHALQLHRLAHRLYKAELPLVPRLICTVSLSYDHRVIDGAAGARFTTKLREVLADVGTFVGAASGATH